MNTAVATATIDACCFLVAGHHFAVRSDCVEEILRGGRPTRVPLAAPEVRGVLHLRGRIVPVIDMRRRLGFEETAAGGIHVVIRAGDDRYGLFVDEVLGVQPFAAERVAPAAAAGPHDPRIGVFVGEGHLIHFLDPQRVVLPLFKQRTTPLITHGASHGESLD